MYAWISVDLSDADIQGLMLIIGSTLIISPGLTLYWIYHTLSIYRLKGERQGELKVNFNYNCDWNGIPVVADWKALQSARFVVLQLAEGKNNIAIILENLRLRNLICKP